MALLVPNWDQKDEDSWLPPPQESELKRINEARKGELEYVSASNTLEVEKAKQMAAIETGKFQNMVQTLGAENIAAIATSGHDNQVMSRYCPGTGGILLYRGR